MDDLISDVQTTFVPNRQILDGPFIFSDLISWCKHKKINAMIFKVEFEKAFDYVRWDYLVDVLKSFGVKWCSWISGCPVSSMGSVLINGSPISEFHFYKGLKQGDPLSPFLFILVMESLHLSFTRVFYTCHLLECWNLVFSRKGIDLLAAVKRKLGSGENTLFWNDIWIGESTLKTKYSRLHALEHCKSILVAGKMGHPFLAHSFRRFPRRGAEDE
uniref:RNA-directed DNA polymerase, eukaryota n=1 Tax=Tanacetum cinerariifolium TaxID=118510 RepID=A0A699JBT6_TANCI|nr:RNA-directed DNA polymerase, eukaryota [Tanacetum cinerariifolium]